MIEPRDYQLKAIQETYDAWASGVNGVFITAPTGSGKCLGRGTPILMFSGEIKPVETVVVGDLLMGPDSKPRTVLSVTSGREDLFRVTPIKGDPYVVNKSHILSLKICKAGGERVKGGNGVYYWDEEISNISISDYLISSKTFKHRAKGWRTGVDFPEAKREFYIPPYILGVWLGDGASRFPIICNIDPEVINEWSSWAEGKGLQCIIKTEDGKVPCYSIRANLGAGKNPFTVELRRLSLIQNKHIPHQYKTASREDRLQLLAGLIDTDGYVSHGGCDIVFKQKQLAEDAVFLARSLGFAAYVSECQKTCTNTGATGTYYRISISGDLSQVPCKVPRRQAPKRKQIKNHLITGITVNPIGEGEYFGFEIDGDRLFMLGDFTVTHNTVMFTKVIEEFVGKNKKCVVVAHRGELIKQAGKTVEKNGMQHGVIKAGPSSFPLAPIQVVSIDSMKSRSLPWPDPDLIILDEAHLAKSKRYNDFLEKYPSALKLLVSATPIRLDGRGFEDIAQKLVVSSTVQSLIDHPQGPFLVPPKIYTGSELKGLNKVKTTAGDFNQGALQNYMMQSGLMGDIVEAYQKFAEGRKGVVFCAGIEHSKQVAGQFESAGIRAEHIDGTTPEAEREAILGRLRSGETTIVTNANVLCEGWDEPSISYVGLARPTKSLALYIQQAGRGLRIHPESGKENCIIVDHGGNVQEHGHILEERYWTLKGKPYREKIRNPYKQCMACQVWIPVSAEKCPHCGHWPIRPKVIFQSQPTEFQEAQIEDLHPVVREYKKLLRFAKQRGHKPGWAYFKLVQKFDEMTVRHHLSWGESKKIQSLVYGEASQ